MSTSSSSSIPSQEIPMVDLDVLDTYSSHDEAPVTQCRRLWFIPENLALPPRNQCGPSHSKRRPSNHVPRPRNAFILFRSHFYLMQVLPSGLDFCKDHRQISRIVSFVWAGLPAAEKQRFFTLSEEELRIHQRIYTVSTSTVTKEIKSKVIKGDPPANEKEARLGPEELQCKRIAEVVLTGLQGDELFAKIEELVAGYIARKNALPNLKKKSGKISKTVITSSTLKETVTATVARVANLPRLPRPKVQRKTSQPKRRSSTSSSKSGKSSLILSSSPPRRRCVPSSFAQYGSDEEPFEEEEVLQFHRGTTPALSVFSEDIVPPPISDSENSSISSTSQSMRSTLIDESSTDSLPQSSTNNSVMSWTEEEEQNHSFDDDDMGERFELMEIVEDNPFSEFGVHLRLDEEANPYEQLERQLFAARERTPFDPDSSFSSLGSSSDAFPGLVTFEGFWDDSVESSPREPSVEPITVSLSDLSPPRRR